VIQVRTRYVVRQVVRQMGRPAPCQRGERNRKERYAAARGVETLQYVFYAKKRVRQRAEAGSQ